VLLTAETETTDTDRQRSSHPTTAIGPHPPHPSRKGNGQDAGNQEVGNLNPSQVAVAEQAERLAADIEAIAGERLDETHDHVERTAIAPRASRTLVA